MIVANQTGPSTFECPSCGRKFNAYKRRDQGRGADMYRLVNLTRAGANRHAVACAAKKETRA